jgi:enoyl-CoA hydratase
MTTIQPEVLGIAKLVIDMYTDVQDRTVQRHIDRLAVTLTYEEFAKGAQRFKK